LKITKQNEIGFLFKLEECIKHGIPLLIENMGEWIDPMLMPILLKEYSKKGLSNIIRLGDTEIVYH
jgi:dynein heavy chain